MVTIYPVKDIRFRISVVGRGATSGGAFMDVVGMESFSITFDNGVDEWNPLDSRGWVRRMVTSKSMTVSLAGKRVTHCFGNDYVAGLAYQSGQGAATILLVEFPNGDELSMPCIVNVTACGGGNGDEVAVLEFDCLSDGLPRYTRWDGGNPVAAAAAMDLGGEADVSN